MVQPAGQHKKRRSGVTEVLLVLLTVLVMLAVFAVLLALVYPEAAREIVTDLSQSLQQSGGNNDRPTIIGQVAGRAGQGYEGRIAPAARSIGNRLKSIFTREVKSERKKKKPAEGPPIDPNECIGCHEHEDLFDLKAINNIYIDHRIHDAAAVKCPVCHLSTDHPKPKTVDQKVCRSCHQKEKAPTDCRACHTPGSILDDAVVSTEKTEHFLSGSRVRTKSLVPHRFGEPDPAWLKGEGDIPCANCHTVPDFCNVCHLAFHKTVPDWMFVHGPRILQLKYAAQACWTCHNPTWCAGNCHVNVGVKRSGRYLDLPSTGLPLD